MLWTFPGDTALSFPPVVAAGYVYGASSKNVYAVDIAAHAQV
ncbi:MAG TPA: PQQ-binding-like beta-propeller repeat protein [Polyangia bacterium]|nr:PQQ-binding-like beta-propeller repeat protein [Polyangia bacterium]